MRICRTPPDAGPDYVPQLQDCLAHRCERHKAIPPIDDSAETAECGLCVGDKLADAYIEKWQNVVFWPLIDSAIRKLDLLSPGVGQRFRFDVIDRVENPEKYDREISREPAEAGMSQPDEAAEGVTDGSTGSDR